MQKSHKNNYCIKQLQELEKTIDWDDLVAAIFPHYVQSEISPISLTVENMLRINILGHYNNLPPSAVREALIQDSTFREFALIDISNDKIPDATCIEDFNSILAEKGLALKIYQALSMNATKNEYSVEY